MSVSLETLTPLSKFRNHIALNNVVVDYIKDSDVDWLDLSKPFIPFVSWLETGHKALVDYPKDLLSYSKHKLTYPLYNTMDMGNLCALKIERTNVVYHALIYNSTSLIEAINKKKLETSYSYNRYTFTRIAKTFFTASTYLGVKKSFSYKKKKQSNKNSHILKTYIIFNKVLIANGTDNKGIHLLPVYTKNTRNTGIKKIRRKLKHNIHTKKNITLDLSIKEASTNALYAKSKKVFIQKQNKHKRKLFK